MSTNPVKSRADDTFKSNFDPFKYGNIVELPNDNSSIVDKIIDFTIFKAKQTKSKWHSTVTLKDMCDVGASYSTLNKALRNISYLERKYLIDGIEYELFEKNSFEYHSGKIDVSFNAMIEPYFDDIREFISYDIEHLFTFKHKFTHSLHKLLYSIGTVRPAEFELDGLRIYLLGGNNNYSKWAEFNRNILAVSQKELRKDASLLQFEYTALSSDKGKQITSVRFRVYYPGEDVVETVDVEKESKLDVNTIKKLFEPEIKITNECAKELSNITNDTERLSNVKALLLDFEHVKDKSEWLKYACLEGWNSELFTVNNLKKIEGDGLVTIQRSVYEVYSIIINCIRNNDWKMFFDIFEYDQIYYSMSNDAQCFLIKEMFDLLIKYYLKFNIKPKVTASFVKAYNYNIYNMIDKIKLLKQCNADYQKNFFKVYDMLQC